VADVAGVDGADKATLLNNIASVLRDQGRLDEALEMHRQAMDIRKRALGEDHPLYASDLNNIALVLRAKGRLDEALDMHREALDIDKRALGEDHPDVAGDLNNIASVLSSQGKHKEAVEEFTKALVILRRVLGDAHPNVATTLWWLAIESRDHEHKASKAKQYADEARRIFDSALGPDHPTTKAFKKQFP
jgi:tetratricopeptide (TPR) repeat protein